MKHRISAFALALLLLMCAVPAAHAAEEPLVAPVRSYSGQFSDVAEDAWYYDAVKYVNENGLMAATFPPRMRSPWRRP